MRVRSEVTSVAVADDGRDTVLSGAQVSEQLGTMGAGLTSDRSSAQPRQ